MAETARPELTMDWTLFGFQGLDQVFNIHPVFVHFPIALFPTTLLFYTIGILGKKDRFLFAGRVCLFLTLTSVIVTVVTGLLAADSFSHNETIHRILMTHQKIGYAILISGALLFIWSFIRKEGAPRFSRLFLLVLLFTVLMVLQNGDLGGRMVFVEGAAVKKPVEGHHHHQH